eukprot:7375980-Prymnesium_polylepis.2
MKAAQATPSAASPHTPPRPRSRRASATQAGRGCVLRSQLRGRQVDWWLGVLRLPGGLVSLLVTCAQALGVPAHGSGEWAVYRVRVHNSSSEVVPYRGPLRLSGFSRSRREGATPHTPHATRRGPEDECQTQPAHSASPTTSGRDTRVPGSCELLRARQFFNPTSVIRIHTWQGWGSWIHQPVTYKYQPDNRQICSAARQSLVVLSSCRSGIAPSGFNHHITASGELVKIPWRLKLMILPHIQHTCIALAAKHKYRAPGAAYRPSLRPYGPPSGRATAASRGRGLYRSVATR